MSAREIANKLILREYYSTVYYEFVLEAVENTLADGISPNDIEAIDTYIRENYI